ncbi:MAG: arsenite efflux transporter metallochaperone ArsD [Myxococcales bacterium]|nr:arsenite efflux transporter metallochaperone ArsD [Myxococcales bacterium]
MPRMQVFDPPMCCSTGVCGPSVDPTLVRFAADLDWLKNSGVEVERYNLGQQPAAFVESVIVRNALEAEGNGCLPIVVVEGKIVSRGNYPLRDALAGYVGLQSEPSLFTEQVKELVAIGAAIAAGCDPCFKFHYDKARKAGVSKEDMVKAVALGKEVREAPGRTVVQTAERYLAGGAAPTDIPSSCSLQPASGEAAASEKKSKCC